MPQGPLENAFGSYGYGTTVAQGRQQGPLHNQNIRTFRNASRSPIGYGQIVTLYVDGFTPYGSSAGGTTAQTGTTADDAVYVTTVNSQRGIIGIALGACSSATGLTSVANFAPRFNGPSSQYVRVVVDGPFYGAIVTSAAHGPGDILVNSATTVSANTTVGFGGIGAAATTVTVPITTAQMTLSQVGTVGWFITTGTTVNSTLYNGTPFTSKAVRANVWVRPSNVTFISGTT